MKDRFCYTVNERQYRIVRGRGIRIVRIYRFFVGCAIIVVITQFAGCATVYRQMKQKVINNYREGIVLYRQGKYASALDRFETVQSIDPEYGDVRRYILITKDALSKKARDYYDRGMQYKKAGEYENALDQFLLVMKEDPDFRDTKQQLENIRKTPAITKKFQAALKRATAYYDRKQYVKAYTVLLQAKKYNDKSLEMLSLSTKTEIALNGRSLPYVSKAEKFYNKKQYAAAKSMCVKALEVNPWDEKAKALNEKCGRKLFVERNYEAAKKKYRSGDYFAAFDLFASVVERDAGYRDAQKYLDAIRSNLGKNVPQYYARGVSEYDNERFTEAIAEFNRVLKINPDHQKAKEYKDRAIAKLEIKRSLEN